MLSSLKLKEIVSEVRPIIERQLGDADQIAGFRDMVSANGGDWGALKALIKAQIQDERDEAGDGKRVRKILDKAEYSTGYAELLGWSNMNEDNFSAEPAHDADGAILDENAAAPIFAENAKNSEPQPQPAAQSQGNLSAPDASPDRREGDDDGQPVSMQEPRVDAEGQGGAVHEHGREEGSHPRLPSDRVEKKPDGPAVIAAEPIQEPQPSVAQAAPVEGRSEGEAGSPDLPTNSNSVSTKPPSPLTEGEGACAALPETSPATGKPGPVQAGPALAPGEVRHEKTPPHGMVRHDFQRCFPDRWGPALADLTDDIRKNGIREPIVMLDGQLLDGWARYLVARDLGIEYPVTEYAGTDPLADVIRWNLETRNLSPEQRKAVASKLMKLPAAEGRHDGIVLLFGLETEGETA